MERKYLSYLEKWLKDPRRKPLMVWGARQVGKSYLIEEMFAKKWFPNRYVRIDCSDDNAFVNFVYNNNNLEKVLDYLRINYDFVPNGDNLLIFDEAQECLPLIKMMKHFCEKQRQIPLIVTGSMVRIKISREAHKRGGRSDNDKFMFPVGKINELVMYPLTFDEFLLNYNANLYDYLKDNFARKKALDPAFHQIAMDAFDDYLFVGGMPEVVDVFIENKDDRVGSYILVNNKVKEIYDNYLADMDLYQASRESIIRSRLIFKDIYKQLNKENKNFKFSLTKEGAKNRDMVNPIGWLSEAKVVNQSFLLKERVTSPLIKEEDSLTRLYLSDMGMFTYQSGINAKTFLTNKDNALSGIFFENYVACELAARGFDVFYWKGKRNSEFEFLIDINGDIVPIDVKKGKDRLNSLDEFRQHNKKGLAIKVSANQYGFDEANNLLTIPFYYLPFYLDDLQKGANN